MVSRCLAILLLVLLALLPAAGEAMAFGRAEHCTPASHGMVVHHDHEGGAARHGCKHGAGYHRLPCAMMGLCSMSGCMALTAIATPNAEATGQRLDFRPLDTLRVDGLALAPPLEPPRG